MTPDFSHFSAAEKRALLADLLRRKSGLANGRHPLSFNQQSLLALYVRSPRSAAYNTAFRFEIDTELDVSALEKALQAMVDRHAVLRTSYEHGSGGAFQNVAASGTCDFARRDASGHTSQQVESWCMEDAAEPFDLERGAVWRVRLYSLSANSHVLLVAVHHIAFDYWSGIVFQQELQVLYNDFRQGRPCSLAPLHTQYVDFVKWQDQLLKKKQGEELADYWLLRLSGEMPFLNLPTDSPRLDLQSFEGKSYRFRLDQQLVRRLDTMARAQNRTLYSLMLAAHAVLLYRYSGQAHFPVGTTAAGRNTAAFEGVLGFFVNTVVLRMNCAGNPQFDSFWQSVSEMALTALDQQDYPFSLLVDKLGIPRDPSRSPLCDALFSWDKAHRSGPDVTSRDTQFPLTDARQLGGPHDLNFIVFERAENLDVTIQYNTDLFEAGTIERMAVHYENLLHGIVDAPSTSIGQLPLLSEQERNQLLAWNDTATEYPRQSCVHELFETQASATPEAIAISFDGRHVSYGELNARANRLARFLKRRGVGPDVLVGVCLERSEDLIVSLLAILKAGGAYVPFDPDYPADRLKFMMDDTRVSIMLTHSSLAKRLAMGCCELVCLDRGRHLLEPESDTNPPVNTTPENLAYVMYTSGSTGIPKGVCIPHRGIVRLVRNTNYMQFGPREVFLQFAPVSFDASTLEIWGSLLNGGRLAVCAPGKLSLGDLGRTIRDQGVTGIFLTSGLFQAMVDHGLDDLRGLRHLLAGGDVLSVSHVVRARTELPECRISNAYGPTENTTFTTFFDTPLHAGTGSLPIGRPISNTQTCILDVNRQLVPIGVVGELYTGGDGLARGYWNRPDLTSAAFIDHPFQPGAKLYKTGDLAKYLPDGNIAFLGRIDSQVKIRGFRVEPGEIEAALKEHDNVQDAIVVVHGLSDNEKRLIGYVVPGRKSKTEPAEIRSFLQKRLPAFMTPSAIVVVDAFPLSPNGKVDRHALPDPFDASPQPTAAAAPTTAVELLVAKVWKEALHISNVGLQDNFFDLGGNSLLLLQVHVRLQEALGKDIAVVELFRSPTVASLAAALAPGTARPGHEDQIKERARRRTSILSRRLEANKHRRNVGA